MKLIQYIHTHIDPKFTGELPFSVHKKQVPKGYVFTDFEEIASKVYFLAEGIAQVEILSKDEIRILDFFFPGSFFASYTSLLTKLPSDVRIRSIMDCEVEIIDYTELKKSYEFSLLANQFGRIETEKLYLRRVQREKQLLTQNAQEHYLELLKKYPQILRHIPLKDISKYLGITPESLSRIRKRIS